MILVALEDETLASVNLCVSSIIHIYFSYVLRLNVHSLTEKKTGGFFIQLISN